MKRNTRHSLPGLLAVVAAALTGGSFYMLGYSLTPKDNEGKDTPGSYEYIHSKYPFITPWLDSLRTTGALRNIFIIDREGRQLYVMFTSAAKPTDKTAAIVHGYMDNAIRMLMVGYLYNNDLNYNILLPDLQDSGLSGGPAIQMGWKDRLDVPNWMNIANDTFGKHARMTMYGISMGAAITMVVSGEVQQPFVKYSVEDCGYTSVRDEFPFQLKDMFGLPEFPLVYTTNWLCSAKYGWNFQEASSLRQVKKYSLPMFFIHEDADTYVPTRMVYPLYGAESEPKELWIVPGATHAIPYKDYLQEYTERVKKFAGKYVR